MAIPKIEGGITVEGFRELQRLFAKADKESRAGMRALEREVAAPVQADAEGFAVTRIPKITPRWATMRIGITRTLIYVAPKQRGAKGAANPRRRPKFGVLLAVRAMQPAADKNQPLLEQRTERFFDEVARRWGESSAA